MTAKHLLELEETGRCWFRKAMPEPELQALEQASDTGNNPGTRLNWSENIEIGLGEASSMQAFAETVLAGAQPVRIVAFNKSSASNWLVPWHQDRVIAIAERHELSGYSAWARKSGVWHCEPPAEILSSMVFARVHLDRSDETNGCLELALGTHSIGAIGACDADRIAEGARTEPCIAERGDVLFVKALTLHRLRGSQSTAGHRALRVDYASGSLSAPLEWALPTNRDAPVGR